MPSVTESTLLVYFKNGVSAHLQKDLIVNGPDSLRKTFDRVRLLSLADKTTSSKSLKTHKKGKHEMNMMQGQPVDKPSKFAPNEGWNKEANKILKDSKEGVVPRR